MKTIFKWAVVLILGIVVIMEIPKPKVIGEDKRPGPVKVYGVSGDNTTTDNAVKK